MLGGREPGPATAREAFHQEGMAARQCCIFSVEEYGLLAMQPAIPTGNDSRKQKMRHLLPIVTKQGLGRRQLVFRLRTVKKSDKEKREREAEDAAGRARRMEGKWRSGSHAGHFDESLGGPVAIQRLSMHRQTSLDPGFHRGDFFVLRAEVNGITLRKPVRRCRGNSAAAGRRRHAGSFAPQPGWPAPVPHAA